MSKEMCMDEIIERGDVHRHRSGKGREMAKDERAMRRLAIRRWAWTRRRGQ